MGTADACLRVDENIDQIDDGFAGGETASVHENKVVGGVLIRRRVGGQVLVALGDELGAARHPEDLSGTDQLDEIMEVSLHESHSLVDETSAKRDTATGMAKCRRSTSATHLLT